MSNNAGQNTMVEVETLVNANNSTTLKTPQASSLNTANAYPFSTQSVNKSTT